MTRNFGPRSWRRREGSARKTLGRTLWWPESAKLSRRQELSQQYDPNQELLEIDPSKPYSKPKLHNLREICLETCKLRKRMAYSKPITSMTIQTTFQTHHITWSNRDIDHISHWKTSISSTWRADTLSSLSETQKLRGRIKIWIKLSIEVRYHVERHCIFQGRSWSSKC